MSLHIVFLDYLQQKLETSHRALFSLGDKKPQLLARKTSRQEEKLCRTSRQAIYKYVSLVCLQLDEAGP